MGLLLLLLFGRCGRCVESKSDGLRHTSAILGRPSASRKRIFVVFSNDFGDADDDTVVRIYLQRD